MRLREDGTCPGQRWHLPDPPPPTPPGEAYRALSGHLMVVQHTRTNRAGAEVPLYATALHAEACPCRGGEDW